MTQRFDIVIIGGGVIGSAIAYFLANHGPQNRILLAEADPTFQQSATPRSAGGIRQQFSVPQNIRISQFTASFLQQAHMLLAIGDERPFLPFKEAGYLFLASYAGVAALQHRFGIQRKEGADIAWLSPEQLNEKFPWLNSDGIGAGTFGLSGEGWIDPYSLLQAFRKKAISLGVTILNDRCIGLETHNNRIQSVQFERHPPIPCGIVVNAAGYRAADIARMASLDLPVRPRKRCIFAFDCRTGPLDAPLTIDPDGVWFRPEGSGFIAGVSPADDPDCLDFEVVHEQFDDIIWPTLAARVPAFEAIKVTGAWAGHYDYNIVDQNAILGAHPDVENLLFACGFSGHGLQQSPAIGRAIAELALHGKFQTLDLSCFGFARILENRPLLEENVV